LLTNYRQNKNKKQKVSRELLDVLNELPKLYQLLSEVIMLKYYFLGLVSKSTGEIEQNKINAGNMEIYVYKLQEKIISKKARLDSIFTDFIDTCSYNEELDQIVDKVKAYNVPDENFLEDKSVRKMQGNEIEELKNEKIESVKEEIDNKVAQRVKQAKEILKTYMTQ
jgi:hypothetical protein